MKKIKKDKKTKAGTLALTSLLLMTIFTAIFITFTEPVKAAETTDFDSWKPITIESDYIDETLTNFPMWIYNISDDWKINETSFSFFDTDNSTELNWELEVFNYTTGTIGCWVNVTEISADTDTTIYIYYDNANSTDGGEHNPESTWDSNFLCVWHMDDYNETHIADSTSTGIDGLKSGTSQVDGTIGYGQIFDGSSDEIELATGTPGAISALLDGEGNVTTTASFKADDVDDNMIFRVVIKSGTGAGIDIEILNDDLKTGGRSTSADDYKRVHAPSGPTTDYQYVRYVADYGNSYITQYINGSLTNQSSTEWASTTWDDGDDQTNEDYIGSEAGTSPYFDGIIDEIRIETTNRSDAWKSADWHSANQTDGFILFDVLGDSNSPPVNSNPSPADDAIDQDLNPTLNITINDPNGDTMNQTFWTNASGSWTAIGWNNDTGNASVENSTTCFDSYSTEYWWSSNVSDGNGGWDNDTYHFTTKDDPGEGWGPWSEGWSISTSHTCSGTGYTYGNWTDAEFVDDNTLDELWTEANDSHWEVNDSSSWWAGNRTYQTNYSLYNSSFTLLNDSGMNRTQLFGWVHNNGTNNYPYPFIIFAYNTSQDFDCLMWIENESHYMNVWILHWNGTVMLDHATGLPVDDPNDNENATDIIDYNEWQGGYISTVGHYFKLIYNNYNGSIKFKWWDGDSFLTEPAGWATEYSHTNITRSGPLCKGIGVWNPTAVGGFMQWDMFNVWQLNYTTNSSDWINISDTNTSRPHMNFPVIDLGTWTEEIMSYFNATAEGNVSLGTIARVMKDNITNPMNLESRAFELKSLDNGQQNDTVYYYSVLLDNFTAFSEESYDEWLHLHIQMTPEDDVETSEYGDFMVGIDVDNNRTWNTNDRVYWAYANSTGLQWNETYDGTGNPKANIAVWNIWESEDNAPGNLHRYTGHLNYAISIPLADLVKSNGEPLNSTDVFGLSIITTTSGTSFVLQDACVWQNWNETTESTYADEENNLTSIMEYFFNYTEELETEGPVPEALHLGRWGEGEIGEGLVASGDVSYAVTIEKSSNISTIAYGSTYALVNYSIWVNNTGSAPLTDVVVNDTRFNCTCHDFNETNFTGTNISWDSVTNYSCYREFNITSIAASGSWHIWYTVNITTCPSVTCGTIQNNASVNATELSTAVTTNNQITWACASAGLSLTETITNLMMFIIVITIITSLLSLVLKKINW